jgi:hypothetical protein
MSEIYLLIEGQQQGPYTEEQVRQSLTEGLIARDLPAWQGGLADWIEVECLLASGPEKLPHRKTSSEGRSSSPRQANANEAPHSNPPFAKNSKPRNAGLRWGWMVVFALIGLAVLGLSIGAGFGLVMSRGKDTASKQIVASEPLRASVTTPAVPVVPETVTYFKVSDKAETPLRGWYGYLITEDPFSQTDVIVVFDNDLNLGKDDRLQGKYVPTQETGNYNDTRYRVYRLEGDYHILDPTATALP